ncbi:TIGR00725 family protein [bacterium]|nr:TIGR00725 family protein [bacterium]MBU0899945.1 TIGR00725 family protein [bacterium]MBU1153150.1 TIGR00725 family protein [bacterium]MBU1782123.1 TIGR00725 family protein [bacterium]MBU2599202.1 TIGR00725 family protein [bacterium]
MQIGVIGAGVCSQELAKLAYEVGYYIGQSKAILICGGLGGVMEEACRGAKDAGGVTVGVLPGLSSTDSNPYLDVKMVTALNEARNLIIVRSSQAIIAISGEYGTLSEIAFALKFKIPIIGLKTWNLGSNVPLLKAKTPQEAIQLALKLGKIHES